jgi:hypothetical protein
MTAVRALISWLLFFGGRIALRFDWGVGYQRLMELSCRVQGNGPGPWAPTPDK